MDYVSDKMNWCLRCREADVPPVSSKLVRAAIASGAGCPPGNCLVCWYRYGRAVPSALGKCPQKKGGKRR